MSEQNPFLISQDELANNLDSFKIVDASWYLPAHGRDGKKEYETARIPGAVFFDIDGISDTSSALPHMLPAPENFAEMVGRLGISAEDKIVVYDGLGLFSAARCWWSLRVMGAKSVRILQGGFDRWKEAGLPVDKSKPSTPTATKFVAEFDSEKVRNLLEMNQNIKNGDSLVLDARPYQRYTGEAAEPRAGLRSGHIPGSRSMPASDLVKDGTLLPVEALREKFTELKLDANQHITTSCGSGVTAAIITLALASIGFEKLALYDGSWSEWGADETVPVARWDD